MVRELRSFKMHGIAKKKKKKVRKRQLSMGEDYLWQTRVTGHSRFGLFHFGAYFISPIPSYFSLEKDTPFLDLGDIAVPKQT